MNSNFLIKTELNTTKTIVAWNWINSQFSYSCCRQEKANKKSFIGTVSPFFLFLFSPSPAHTQNGKTFSDRIRWYKNINLTFRVLFPSKHKRFSKKKEEKKKDEKNYHDNAKNDDGKSFHTDSTCTLSPRRKSSFPRWIKKIKTG